MECEDGQYVATLFGNSGKFVDSIGLTCSDGRVYGRYGGDGGGAWYAHDPDGFLGMNIRAGSTIDNIAIYDSAGAYARSIGSSKGGGLNN